MDKGRIKSFSVWARRSLMGSVKDKAEWLGIYSDRILDSTRVQGGFMIEGREEVYNYPIAYRNALVKQIKEKGFEQVIEEAAYTWFNRFMGLRYMEVNDYLPSGIRILSSEVEGKTEPDVLSRISETVEELDLDFDEIYKLLDSGTVIDREKAYRIILVKQCNDLGSIIPQMFSRISDYTELLLPDNLLQEGSVIRRMIEDISEEDWKEEIEIIGWMYQYYISEKKDEVFADLKKNIKISKENIPAATQLFTPKWIVKYMVENSLGRLWLEGHPNKELQEGWKYYLEEVEQEPEVEAELQKIREGHSRLTPEDIKILDPCMGSGHILVYAFDVLYEIYKSAGYSEREIPRLILQNNLYGLDIDDRAAQLAYFALIMKARHYNRRLFREIERQDIELNLCSIQESNDITKEAIDYFVGNNEELKTFVDYLIEIFTDAKEYGSILEVNPKALEVVKMRVKEIGEDNSLMFADYRNILLEKLPLLIKQAEIMSRKYEVCITNPPYMGNGGMSNSLFQFVKLYYPDSKSDLFAVFIEKCIQQTSEYGFTSVVTMQSWMFLSSFKELRKKILQYENISALLHMDNMVMGIAFGTSATVFRKKIQDKYAGVFTRVNNHQINKKSNCPISFPYKENIYRTKNINFNRMVDSIIAYWVSDVLLNIIQDNKTIKDIGYPCIGMRTGDNNRFLRFWFEVDANKMGIGFNNSIEAINSKMKWFPYNKGGAYRKWYGNNEYVVNWENDGYEIKENTRKVYPYLGDNLGWKISNEKYYFKQGITWSGVTNGKFGIRFYPNGMIFDSGANGLFAEKDIFEYIGGYLNSRVAEYILEIINPTVNTGSGTIGKLPLINSGNTLTLKKIKESVNYCISKSKSDWDSFESSWDFKRHPLLIFKSRCCKVEDSFNAWEIVCDQNFNDLKYNEEVMNRIFIDIYGLQDELTPEVEDKYVTIRKADRTRDIKSFISYAVGCILGRYSIDAEGLIYAGGRLDDKWNFSEHMVRKIDKDGNMLSDSWVQATFMPDEDNIIPITEEEYFEDDIVSRFIEFVRVTFSVETLEENLDYIADSIGRKNNETSRQAIRRYFVKDFYNDHLKTYQKTPIYWLFDSGKNDGFKALIYMHRYNNQTVAKVRTKYLHTLQRKYETEVLRQQHIIDSMQYSNREKAVSKKKIERLNKQIQEIKEYDQIVAYIANEQIDIDLDDGVKVNYAKFQDIKIINSKGKEIKMNLLAKI